MNAGAEPGGAHALSFRHVSKRYGAHLAIDELSFDVAPGEFLTLLGASGSGKTSILRLVAGLLQPDAGEIKIDGRDVTRVPAHKRNVGVVFQSYALFPHMTAEENVVFPLRMRGVPKATAEARVADALASVNLESKGSRYPRQLSGGEQQRVALARALVFRPRLLLMDEPLSALDRKLRERLQIEIKRLHQELGITVVYVTHDQEEALVLSDRIVLLRLGKIEQHGSGEDLYERPTSLYVAQFIGDANIFRGRIALGGGKSPSVHTITGDLPVAWTESLATLVEGQECAVVVRPEAIKCAHDTGTVAPNGPRVHAVVRLVTYLGSTRKYELETPEGNAISMREPASTGEILFKIGDEVSVSWDQSHAVVVPV